MRDYGIGIKLYLECLLCGLARVSWTPPSYY
jgi:hypothetical protein